MRTGVAALFLALVACIGAEAPSAAGAGSHLRVAATVAPIHSLVAMVTEGIVEPDMIVRPGASPHDYALKPSEAAVLNDADVVFWVGEGLEPWMSKALTTLADDAVVVELGEIDRLLRLPLRQGGAFSTHDDDAAHDHGDHGHGEGVDTHFWLDPGNAVIWLAAIAGALADADPDRADAYRGNADTATETIEAIAAEIDDLLTPVKEAPYVVFHDGYQYFERRFDLHPVGAVMLSDADRPGPARLIGIREAIAESEAVCIFAEPQFAPKLIETVTEGLEVGRGTLDPIGAGLEPGAGLYPTLIRALAEDLVACLGRSGEHAYK